jgi:hypothetical protein
MGLSRSLQRALSPGPYSQVTPSSVIHKRLRFRSKSQKLTHPFATQIAFLSSISALVLDGERHLHPDFAPILENPEKLLYATLIFLVAQFRWRH